MIRKKIKKVKDKGVVKCYILDKNQKEDLQLNNLIIFNHQEFGEIRVLELNGEPWFVGKDVAEKLGYINTRDALKVHVDNEDKGITKCDTLGGNQNMTIINESGLYSLTFNSKLPGAKRFKRWVTSEVLPSIRKHGTYTVPIVETIESYKIQDHMQRYVAWINEQQELLQERSARIEAEKKLQELKNDLKFNLLMQLLVEHRIDE